jgi:hypothetical protein
VGAVGAMGAGGGIVLVLAHDVADCVFYGFHLCYLTMLLFFKRVYL